MSLVSPTARAVAALSLTQLIGWGASFWLPAVTGPAMAKDLAMPLPLVMAGPTVMLVVMAFSSWPLAGLFERCGARPVMVWGSPLGAAGVLMVALSEGPVTYGLAWAVLGLAGAAILTTPAQIAIAEIAGEGARRALGVLVMAGGLTSTIIWPLTGLLQAYLGWRATTLCYAGLILVVCMPLHAATLARRPPRWQAVVRAQGEAQGKPEDGAPEKPEHGAGVAPAVDLPRFLLLAAGFAANGFFTWGFALTVIILFETGGLDHAQALAAAALIGIAQWAGRLIDLLGAGRISGFATGLLGAALFPLSFVILLVTGSFHGAVAFATLYGVASGAAAVTRATLPLQVFPQGAYARASARLAVPLNLSYAAAPPVFTTIMTSAGPHAALWLAFALSLLSFAMLFILRLVHRRGERQPG